MLPCDTAFCAVARSTVLGAHCLANGTRCIWLQVAAGFVKAGLMPDAALCPTAHGVKCPLHMDAGNCLNASSCCLALHLAHYMRSSLSAIKASRLMPLQAPSASTAHDCKMICMQQWCILEEASIHADTLTAQVG